MKTKSEKFLKCILASTLAEIGNNMDDGGTEKEQIHPAYGAPFSINAKMKVVIQIHYSLVHITTMKTERETMAGCYMCISSYSIICRYAS